MKQYHPIPWSSMVLDPIASNKSKNWSVPPFKRWFQSEWNVFCRFCILIQTIPNVGSGFRLHSLDFQCAPDGLTCGSHNPQGAGQAGQAVSSTRPMYNICLLWNSGRAVCHTNDLGLEPWHFGGTQKKPSSCLWRGGFCGKPPKGSHPKSLWVGILKKNQCCAWRFWSGLTSNKPLFIVGGSDHDHCSHIHLSVFLHRTETGGLVWKSATTFGAFSSFCLWK